MKATQTSSGLRGLKRYRFGEFMDKDVRQQPQRFIQRPWHDSPRINGQADDSQWQKDKCSCLCINRRYLCGACHILCGCRHPVYRIPAEGEGLNSTVDTAYSKRLTRIIT